jgi:hypothetical protein
MELSRILLGLVVAALLPYDIPSVAGKRLACLAVSWLYAAYALVGTPGLWKTVVIFCISACWSVVLCIRRVPRANRAQPGRGAVRQIVAAARSRTVLALACATVSALAIAMIYNRHEIIPFARHLLHDNQASIVLSGLLLAVIVGHEPVIRASAALGGAQLGTPYLGVNGVDRLGVFLGWFERALIFVFIVGGQPSGAALALTAKSLARYPALERNEISGEYFLAGTFSSVLVAMFAGILTRLCLNLSPM